MAKRIMKAIQVTQFGGPEVLKYITDHPIPTPQEGQVLIKMQSIGVNPVETYVRSGTYPKLPSLPYIPGGNVAGTIEELGQAASKFKKGDRVYSLNAASGAYAEYCIADERFTYSLPDNLTFHQGAGCGTPYFTAYKALHIRANVKPGETVLVHGASGAVGTAACQLARAFGCKVLGTAGTEDGQKIVKDNGGHQAFNHREEGYMEKIMESTNGCGIDVIIEMLANVNLQNDLKILAKHGRVIVVGNRGTIEIDARLTMGKDADIRGMSLPASDHTETSMMAAHINAGFEQGWLKPVVGQVFPLAKAAQAHTEVIEHPTGTRGKIVLSSDGN